MSELIQQNDNRATIRWKLLTGVSALALTAYVSATSLARAEDADRPALWIELGGQMEQAQGLNAPFTAPFMSAITPTPDVYKGDIFTREQKPPRFAFGTEGKISFQPEDSDWIFSAGIRYGRSHANEHAHQQGPSAYFLKYTYSGESRRFPKYAAPFADVTSQFDEKHAILDFSAGKDVGLGAFGEQGTSTISAGVRLIQSSEKSNTKIYARPLVGLVQVGFVHHPTFYQYTMSAQAERSFRGAGPSLSWNASADLAGNKRDGELTLDWGITGAVLFGKQRAKTSHSTKAYHLTQRNCLYTFYGYCHYGSGYPQIYSTGKNSNRSRQVTVPNISGFAGMSLKWTNAKISIGYRYDTFLNAMDTGIDTAKKSNLSFNGPYASISIGLGD